jgi:hypothetical protein
MGDKNQTTKKWQIEEIAAIDQLISEEGRVSLAGLRGANRETPRSS